MTVKKHPSNKKNELSFEEALQRLQKIINKLEDATLPLEISIQLYKEGITLSRLCKTQLEKAEQEVKILTDDGTFEPFELPNLNSVGDIE